MRKSPRVLIPAAAALLLFSCREAGREKITLAVIPKGTTHSFWQSVHAGAIKAGRELGVDIVWVGPEREDARQQQISIVDNQVINQVSGIILAPLDDVALRRPAKAAADKNIPVLIFDSDLQDSDDFTVSFVATDNDAGGQLAGKNLGEMLGGRGKVIMLRYAEGSASTEKREAGFLAALAAFPGITVVSADQYAGPTATTGQQASENLILRFKDAQGRLTVDGIFTPNETSTFGMLQALRRNRLSGTVRFIGFDASAPLVEALANGEIDGLVVQNPFQMGYLSVKTMVDHLNGRPVEKRIDTGVAFVNRANMNEPAMQQLLQPDLSPWLN
ncbi:MAG: substrate-binding domain-containing protein [candidate division KSB1 bacterium]|nr:substrate-binding domain-containing protein [candidate division KSB1 bacterium]MDZ7276282.1 substrate-binding domain-containing protein [candidate division KSB1 bacterium]MDZ7287912.1 substrate-binding domain-containing protein [candidate division KSB1 bacterium]MDZ7300075.1 substrate-binding domain-containing protein [candidate division KSB1 bacterium]MDZ7308148.1 substrate-binding domain-containing protein [candidate division KSB1 bacterium]